MTIKEFFEMYNKRKSEGGWQSIRVDDCPRFSGGPDERHTFFSIYKNAQDKYVVEESTYMSSKPFKLVFDYEEDAVECLRALISRC